jgi:hypothetical protein
LDCHEREAYHRGHAEEHQLRPSVGTKDTEGMACKNRHMISEGRSEENPKRKAKITGKSKEEKKEQHTR